MLVVVRSSQFKRDVKTAQERGKDLTKLQALLKNRGLCPQLTGTTP